MPLRRVVLGLLNKLLVIWCVQVLGVALRIGASGILICDVTILLMDCGMKEKETCRAEGRNTSSVAMCPGHKAGTRSC